MDLTYLSTICQYYGFDVKPVPITGQHVSRLKSEGVVHKQLGISKVGDCRRFLQLIQDIKSSKPLKQPRDINLDGDTSDCTKWSVGQVVKWASTHGLSAASSILVEQAIAGDVLLDINLESLFLLSNFPAFLQFVIEDELEALRSARKN